ncbi:hypothetical protein Dda_7110 [Drechslerella dactyloides]|uniref:Zn(2)-C6 fungal-type domain-containing protein n=1 Tax=Drechslerella dactyloides TaxID=74499 RepID=A0AAD6NG17_DREDA|nr:hypothetical protein Dda_7110 [Drechslerella dactyloides]
MTTIPASRNITRSILSNPGYSSDERDDLARGTSAYPHKTTSSGLMSTFITTSGNLAGRTALPPTELAVRNGSSQETMQICSNSYHYRNSIAYITHRNHTAYMSESSGEAKYDGANLQSSVITDCHRDPKYTSVATDQSAPCRRPQERAKSKFSTTLADIEIDSHRITSSDVVVQPTYHSHRIPITNDVRMAYAGNEGRFDKKQGCHGTNEEPAKIEDMRPKNSANFDTHIAGLRGIPQSVDALNYHMAISLDMTSPDGVNSTTAQQRTKTRREFARRTKTGCITCRRRKKKCDEGKPKCW